MMNHTRGPWEADATRMVLGPCFTGELKSIVDKVRGGSPAEAHANARLIAAAPDLLAALIELYAVVKGECPSLLDEDSGGSARLDAQIADAIAKATLSLTQP